MNTYYSIEDLHRLFMSCNQKITTDTRKIDAGSIFFALKGENFDANLFAEKAIEQGCKYAIVDNLHIANGSTILLVEDVLKSLQELAKFHRKQLVLPVIGITGSNGKTTHKELIHAVLSKKYNTYATKGNLNNHIGVPLTLLALTKEHEVAIIEMGANHQGEIEMLCDLSDPDFGIITNIGKAHLEGFGGEEGIKKGKSELYQYIKQKNGKIFINGSDHILEELSTELIKIVYGEKEEFDIHGKLIENSEYVEFQWNTKNNKLKHQPVIKTHMFGYYNFINLLCAACIGNYFGVKEHDINDALSNYIPEMNRSQVKKTAINTLILDAYNANPDSMHLAIENYVKQSFKNKWIILGDMLELGNYSYDEHNMILKQLISYNIENVVLVGEQFLQFEAQYPTFYFFKNVEDAVSYFKANKINQSTILIKGSRGLKLEKLVDVL